MTEPFIDNTDGWVMRVQPPADPAAPTLLLLHGWTGDETVMWIFTRKLAGKYRLIAPRGNVPADGGWGWAMHEDLHDTRLEDFAPAAHALMQALDARLPEWGSSSGAMLNVMGFSQGAALAYALGMLYPQRIGRIAALAGFLPLAENETDYARALALKPIYIAHGRQDQTIPIRFAERAAEILNTSGAAVHSCISDAGHKLTLDCLRGLEAFFQQ